MHTSMRAGYDYDTEIVRVGDSQEQAWRTGNGEVLPSVDNNQMGDEYMEFDVDDDDIYQVASDSIIRISVEYLDEGRDTFNVHYDAQSGGPYGDGTYKETDQIVKTDSGKFKIAEFILTDARFSNRDGGADFRIADHSNGAETIRRVTVTYLPPGAAGSEELLEAATLEEEYKGWLDQGFHKSEAGDIAGAVEDINKAIELKPGAEAYFTLANVYFGSGEPQYLNEALNALNTAIEFDPTNYDMLALRGRIYWQGFGDAENARRDFDLAIEVNGHSPDPYNWRGLFFLETGQFDLCVQDYTVFFSLDPDNPWAPLDRAECYVGLGEVDLARQDFQTFLEMTEGNSDFSIQRKNVQTWLDEH